jgi:hypothetical protein
MPICVYVCVCVCVQVFASHVRLCDNVCIYIHNNVCVRT